MFDQYPPCDPLPISVADLSYQLSQQSFQYTPSSDPGYASFSTQSNVPALDCPPIDNFHNEDAVLLPDFSQYSFSGVRLQRQRALRRQCSAGHLREISALVTRMIENEEQCSVCSPQEPPDGAFDLHRPESYISSTRSSISQQGSCYSGGRRISTATTSTICTNGDTDKVAAADEELSEEHQSWLQTSCGDGIGSLNRQNLQYRRCTDRADGGTARSAVAKDVRIRKHRRRRGNTNTGLKSGWWGT